jgi:diadenosine tetraphosphate (Ap4A) HIT family hydrolase
MTNATAVSFGYPETQIAETASWRVLVRPKQPTFGALVMICKDDAKAFSDISAAAFADLQIVVKRVESMLGAAVNYQKINYLMLMMVDPDVHFHVIPRYEGERTHEGVCFRDAGWPGPPALGEAVDLGKAGAARLAVHLRTFWPTS